MNFMFSWQEQYLTSERSERVRYCSCHSNIKFISSRHRVISSKYLYCVSDEFGNDFIHEERLQISEAGRKQNESILKSFSSLKHALVHNLEEKKVLNFYLLYKLRKFGAKSRNSLATKTTLNFSGPCRRVRPAKLTNHITRTNLEI